MSWLDFTEDGLLFLANFHFIGTARGESAAAYFLGRGWHHAFNGGQVLLAFASQNGHRV